MTSAMEPAPTARPAARRGRVRQSRPVRLSAVREVPAPSRRDELLGLAARLFAERGFAGVTMDDIGAACGISGPALYHHFAGKEALLGEMLVAISEHLLAQGRHAQTTVPGALDFLVDGHVQFAVDHPELITVHYRDLVHAAEADRRRVRRLQGRYVECWVAVLGREAGAPEPRVIRAAVHATLGLINSTPFSARLARDDMMGLLRSMALGALRSALEPTGAAS
jgi:AcrR family transcriptional regulator